MKKNLLYFASDWKVGLTTAHFEQICELNKENDIELHCISSVNGAFFTNAGDLSRLLVKFYNNPEIVVNMANTAFVDKNAFMRDNVMKQYKIALGKA